MQGSHAQKPERFVNSLIDSPRIAESEFRIQDSRFKRSSVVYKRFEELPVWQASIELALAT